MNSAKKNPYPLFIPPGILGTKNKREWTAKEAKAYFQWLMESAPSRIQKLLEYFDEPSDHDHERLLLNLGRKAAEVVHLEEFSVQTATGRELTNRGYALAADIGLLIGKMLLDRSNNKLSWIIVKKPKSHISFNFPVITGFRVTGVCVVNLDPILASTSQLSGLLDGSRGVDVWLGIYDYWKNEIPAEPVAPIDPTKPRTENQQT